MPNLKEIEEKVIAGGELTAEEEKVVMGMEPEKTEDNDPYGDFTDDEKEDGEEKEKKPEAKEVKPPEKKEPAKEPEAKELEKKPEDTNGERTLTEEELETELAKPRGMENLQGLSHREKGIFYAMKREREKRQTSERELESLKFTKLKESLKEDLKEGEGKKPQVEPEVKKDPDEFVTQKDLEDREEKRRQQEKQKEEDRIALEEKNRVEFSERAETEAREKHKDYDAVMEAGARLIQLSPKYLQEVATAYKRGENVALLMYDIIKKDAYYPMLADKFGLEKVPAELADKTKTPTPESIKNASKVKENAEKTKTSGTDGGSGGSGGDGIDGYSPEELLSMPNQEWLKLPKKTRDAILKKYG